MRRCHFIFDYDHDLAEARQIAGLGLVGATSTVGFNGIEDWQQAKSEGVSAVKKRIDSALSGASVSVILIGARTASLGYVTYAIERSIHRHCGLLGIFIHPLKGAVNGPSRPGPVPLADRAAELRGGHPYDTYDWDQTQFVEWVNSAATEWRNYARPRPLNQVPPNFSV